MNEKVWIANSALLNMEHLASVSFPLETGGMLLGYVALNNEYVITNIIGPGPLAVHKRYGFTPDGEFQQSKLEKAFLESDGRITYLGDWHTHPKCINQPSWLDKRTLSKIARHPDSGIAHPLMAILGNGAPKWEIKVVRYDFEVGYFLKKINLVQLTSIVYKS